MNIRHNICPFYKKEQKKFNSTRLILKMTGVASLLQLSIPIETYVYFNCAQYGKYIYILYDIYLLFLAATAIKNPLPN